MLLAVIMGIITSKLYQYTHSGLSYSQSFALTVVFVCFIVAVVMMVIGNSLARAFALVGALSIIRFRTVVKDKKDTAYIFTALAFGMSSGTSNYFLALSAMSVFVVLTLYLHYVHFAKLNKSEFVLRLVCQASSQRNYDKLIEQLTSYSRLLHLESANDKSLQVVAYDIKLKADSDEQTLINMLSNLEEVVEVRVLAAKNNYEY